MRRRSLLLALLAVGLGLASGATLGASVPSTHDDTGAVTSARAELLDVAAPTAVVRIRDGAAHDHRTRDVATAVSLVAALALGVGWWLAREGRRRPVRVRVRAGWPSRAPPPLPFLADC